MDGRSGTGSGSAVTGANRKQTKEHAEKQARPRINEFSLLMRSTCADDVSYVRLLHLRKAAIVPCPQTCGVSRHRVSLADSTTHVVQQSAAESWSIVFSPTAGGVKLCDIANIMTNK